MDRPEAHIIARGQGMDNSKYVWVFREDIQQGL
jgi:hypothetical protein